MVEPVGVTLAAVALIFPIYDACDRIYRGWQTMQAIGQDWQLCFWQLDGLWNRLYLIMRRKLSDLHDPIDPNDPQHRVTRSVILQLAAIKIHFGNCDNILNEYMFKASLAATSPPRRSRSNSQRSTAAIAATMESSSIAATQSTALTAASTPSNITAASSQTTNSSSARPQRKSRPMNLLFKRSKSPRIKPTKSQVDPAAIPTSSAAFRPADSRIPIPALRLPDVDNAIANYTETSDEVRRGVGFWRRGKWARDGQEHFGKEVSALRTAISDLDEIVKLRQLSDQSQIVHLPPDWITKSYKNPEIQDSLSRLEAALRTKNPLRAGKPQLQFDIFVADSYQSNWDLMHSQDSYLPLRLGSAAFYIQMTKRGAHDQQSTFLVVDTQLKPARESTPTGIAEIGDLAVDPISPENSQEAFEVWGLVPTPSNRHDSHLVFREKAKWVLRGNLASLFDNEVFGLRFSILAQLKLAMLIVQARLDFCRAKPSRYNSRLESILYYEPQPGEDQDTTSMPNYLQPYLSNGFGQPAPHRRAGASTNSDLEINPIIELGLILYQLGSKKKISYTDNTAGVDPLSIARNKAMADLHSVGEKCGPQFQSTVELCLTSRHVQPDKIGAEERVLEKVLNAIDHLQQTMNSVIR